MNVVEDGQTVELEHLPIYLSEVDELEEDTPEHSHGRRCPSTRHWAAYEEKLILAAMKASNWKIGGRSGPAADPTHQPAV